MGEVILKGMLERELASPEQITVSEIDTERRSRIQSAYGVKTVDSNTAAASDAGIILLAVKPQTMASVLDELSGTCRDSHLVISIAAGITIKYMESRLAPGTRVVRVMPNTPALVGRGASAIAAGTMATNADCALVQSILDAVGITAVVEEKLMDAFTGLSGSGPAYAFIMIEALSDAGVLMGLPRATAQRFAAQTLLGAAQLCLETGKHPGELKDMVTSPGGTTIAAVKELEKGKIRDALMNAVEAATQRSRELGSS